MKDITFKYIINDIYGGLTAAVVALPLALAFGVASGAGAISGLYGAILVGFFTSAFGGTQTQISGPNGPMTVAMAAILTHAAASGVAYAFTAVILGGALQILFGVLKFGRYIRLIPISVVSGFMSGIGIIIILLQLTQLFGQSPTNAPLQAIERFNELLVNINYFALMLGCITLLIIFITPQRISKIVPSILFALIIATLISVLFLPAGSMPIIGEIPTGLPVFVMPIFDFAVIADILKYSIILALLGSVDSLLTALVADNATGTQHDSNKELVGQGIGNMIAGSFGGLPGAGATMRTVVNIKSGGKTRLSGMIHSIALLIIVLGAGGYAPYIPHSVLAAILIKVGIDIIDWQSLSRLKTTPRSDVLVMLSVLLLTVFVDLITAVAVGVTMASLVFTIKMSDLQMKNFHAIKINQNQTQVDYDIWLDHDNKIEELLICHLKGPMSFGAARDTAIIYKKLLPAKAVMLDLTEVTFIDHASIRTLENIIEISLKDNIPVVLCAPNELIHKAIKNQLVTDRHVDELLFNDKSKAIVALAELKSLPSI